MQNIPPTRAHLVTPFWVGSSVIRREALGNTNTTLPRPQGSHLPLDLGQPEEDFAYSAPERVTDSNWPQAAVFLVQRDQRGGAQRLLNFFVQPANTGLQHECTQAQY